MEREKVYISGPITGWERDEYMTRFAIAERGLLRRGFRVCNPTRLLVCRWPWLYRLVGYRLTLAYDLWQLMRCDAIYLMPGYINSRGARIEEQVAYYMKVRYLAYGEDGSITQQIKDYDEAAKRLRTQQK